MSDLFSRSIQIDNHINRPNLPKDCFYEGGKGDILLFPEYYDLGYLKKCGIKHYSDFSHPYTEEDFLNFIRNNKFTSKDNSITKILDIFIMDNSNAKTTPCCFLSHFLGSFIDVRVYFELNISHITTLVKFIERNFVLYERN